MARLYLFAEGRTEQTYADTVLQLHLARFGVYLHKPVLVAHARKRHQIHRGGGRKYAAMKSDLLRFLKQEQGDDVFFTTMIDLYAIYADIPGRIEADQLRHDPLQRVECLETALAEDVGDRRFIPYLQLHEFEALLFVDPACFQCFYDDVAQPIANLQAISQAFGTPELIDDGPQTAPSKRIIRELPDYEDAKPAVGPRVAELIGLENIRAACSHFNAWLTRLERLAGQGDCPLDQP